MAKKSKVEKVFAINVTQNKVSLLEGKIIIESGMWSELIGDEAQHMEVLWAKRKGWITLTDKEPTKPLFEPKAPLKAIDATKGLAAALGGHTSPPPSRKVAQATNVKSAAIGQHVPFVEDNSAETKLTEKKATVKKPKARRVKGIAVPLN